MKAYIYFKQSIIGKFDKDYTGEGLYVLVDENGKEINHHYCSSRGFAEGDLTTTFSSGKQILTDNDITEVWSNNRVVYRSNSNAPKSFEELWSYNDIAENAKRDFLDYFTSGINFDSYDRAVRDLEKYVKLHTDEFSTLTDGELYNKYFSMIDKFYKDYNDPIF